MNKKKMRTKPREEMRKPEGWPKKLQGGCREKRKRKEKLRKRQLEKQRKMQRMEKKKRKISLMRSYRSKKQRG